MYVNKWLALGAAIFIQLCGGMTYVFSVYATDLKHVLHYTQPQIQTVGSFANMGGYLGIVSGLAYDYMEDWFHLGPRLMLVIGVVFNTVGYTLLYSVARGWIRAAFWQVALFTAIGTNGGCWYDTVALVTSVRNFPDDRGTVVGILKSFIGLSGSVFTQLYVAYFQPDAIRFLLFMAIFASLIPLVLGLPAINHVPFKQRSEYRDGNTQHRFLVVYGVVLALSGYLMVASLWESEHPGSTRNTKELLSAGIACLLAPVLFLSRGGGGKRARTPRNIPEPDGPAAEAGAPAAGGVEEPLLLDEEGGVERAGEILAPPAPAPDKTLVQAMTTVDFWLLYVMLLNGTGAALVLLNNLGQLVQALGGGADGQDVFVSLFSVANCAGRLVAGFTSQMALRRLGVARTWFLLGSATGTVAVSGLLAFSGIALLYPAAFFSGLVFGSYWALFPTVCSEVFGMRHLASIYNLLMSAPALGGFAMGSLSSALYDRALASHGVNGPEAAAGADAGTCIGSDCYRSTFLMIAACGLVSLVATGLLVWRTAPIYAEIRRAARRKSNERQPAPADLADD